MRRMILLITAMAVAILLAGGVALAKNISCARQGGNVCVGTNKADAITGTNRADTIKARGGDDTVLARGGKDKIFGGDGFDGILDGGPGNDTLNAGPSAAGGFDYLTGGLGDDTLVESPGVDRYVFEPGWGQDTITGNGDQPGVQADDDDLCFSCGSVSASLTVNLGTGTATDGTNTVTWDTTSSAFIESVVGGSGADDLTGSSLSNIVNGSSGGDTITVSGDGGNDIVNCGGDTDADTVTKDTADFIVPNSCDGDLIINAP